MQHFFLLLVLSLLAKANYHQDALWSGKNFFPNFNFAAIPDPTHGYVTYIGQDEAFSSGLVRDSSPVYMGADHTNVASGSGRKSIRLESKQRWTVTPGSSTYMFVIDLTHMPTGCGTWPAWWFFGPNWPVNGEIDIIEGVHTQTFTQTTLHTNGGCGMGGQPGNWITTTCESGGSNNDGCGQRGPGNSFGAPFNQNQGGVFVALWEHNRIASWFFPRGGIPADLAQGSQSANPNTWGAPYASFPIGGNCPYNHFAQQAMTFDLTFCGDWAGNTFGSACPGKGSCNSYVQNNPSAFSEAFWTINFVKILSQAADGNSPPAPSVVTPQPVSNPPPQGGGNGGSGCTCQAISSANPTALQQALDWACGQVNCAPINQGGAHFEPNTLQAHASYAFNTYYQNHGRDSGACNFNGVAHPVCQSNPPPPPPPTGGSTGGSGCVCKAIDGANPSVVQQGLDWACGQVNCAPINQGGANFNPNTLTAHASYAFNAWYQKSGRDSGACNFNGVARTVCTSSPPPPRGCTCSAKANANQQTLQGSLDWVCGQVNCAPINQGGANFNPNTLSAHASWAFNSYYQQHVSQGSGACDFSGTAQLTCSGGRQEEDDQSSSASSGGLTTSQKAGIAAGVVGGVALAVVVVAAVFYSKSRQNSRAETV